MGEQGRFVDLITHSGSLRPIYVEGCKPDLCDIVIDSDDTFFGRLVNLFPATGNPTPVYGVLMHCAKGPYQEYVAKNCHYPWGVSDRVRFQIISNARACNEKKCFTAEMIWSAMTEEWTGSYPGKNGTLDLALACVSDGQGPFDPGTVIDDASAGAAAWTNPGNASGSDDIYATATPGAGQETHYLVATNFGFAVPGGATITHIKVEIEAAADQVNAVIDWEVLLVLGGMVFSGVNVASGAALGTVDTVRTYAGNALYWSVAGFTPAIVNDATFGVAVRYKNTSGAGRTVLVDSIKLTVICPAHFTLTLSGCQSGLIDPLSKECDFPLLLGAQLGLESTCCAVSDGTVTDPTGVPTVTDPIDFVIYGFRQPVYAARFVDVRLGKPIYGYPECCTQLRCQPTACCDMQPFQSNIPILVATFSNKQGTCVCLPAGTTLYWIPASQRWEGPGIATCPLTECEEATFLPTLVCCSTYGLVPQWKNFRWTEACSGGAEPGGSNRPTSGSCGPDDFYLVFTKTIQGGTYTVTITRP